MRSTPGKGYYDGCFLPNGKPDKDILRRNRHADELVGCLSRNNIWAFYGHGLNNPSGTLRGKALRVHKGTFHKCSVCDTYLTATDPDLQGWGPVVMSSQTGKLGDLWLVLLCACNSSEAAVNEQGTPGLRNYLLQQGVPHVISFWGLVNAAVIGAKFSRYFWQNLQHTTDVRQAAVDAQDSVVRDPETPMSPHIITLEQRDGGFVYYNYERLKPNPIHYR